MTPTPVTEDVLLEYHKGETWLIDFVAHDGAGNVLAIPDGSTATFVLTNLGDVVLTAVSPTDITFTDAPHGVGVVKVTTTMQTDAHLDVETTYRYWLRIETPDVVSVQAVGKFHMMDSPFS